MFSVAPEYFCSLLLTEYLTPQEAAVIKGAREYSKYIGYRDEFKYDGDFQGESQPLDKFVLRDMITVVIEAINFGTADLKMQFDIQNVLREINKALAGFQHSIQETDECYGFSKPVATDRWGFGAFRGELRLALSFTDVKDRRERKLFEYLLSS